jgi:hypothetical protein
VIGYHELEGTKVALKKPIAILKKIKHSDGMEIDPQLAATPVSVEMQVVGIIRHKLLFKTRPKALISSKVLLNNFFLCYSFFLCPLWFSSKFPEGWYLYIPHWLEFFLHL